MLNYSVNKVELVKKKPPGVKLGTLASPELSLDHLNQHCRCNQQPTMAKSQSGKVAKYFNSKTANFIAPGSFISAIFSFLKTDLDQKKISAPFPVQHFFGVGVGVGVGSFNQPKQKLKYFQLIGRPSQKWLRLPWIVTGLATALKQVPVDHQS